MLVDIEAIVKVCGAGSYLQIGCSHGTLVHDLLKRSMNAYGIDASPQVVAQHAANAPGRFLQGTLRDYPFAAKTFDTIIVGAELLYFSHDDLRLVLAVLQQMAKRNVVLYFPQDVLAMIPATSSVKSRLFWEKAFINAGMRRHTREMTAIPYHELENENIARLTFFEAIPERALEKYSLQWLAANRDLHMDMLREAGRRSDGHVSRYALASLMVRPGDVVLDAACGLGYGTAVLAACSPGARFIGVDIDETSIDYAKENYAAANPTISYHASDVTQLKFLPDHSVDMIVSFETIEHVQDYDVFLAEAKRVLKPDGRFIGSVPNLWCDETGQDPNPYHFHVFDWNKLHQAISKYFIVDGRWTQTAGGGYKVHDGQRSMYSVPLAQNFNAPTEWWIVTACANPLPAAAIPYTNPFVREKNAAIPPHVDFAKYYNNPWLYRVMVQLGERLFDHDVLVNFCAQVVKQSPAGSADQGAALCVLAYQVFEKDRVNLEYFAALLEHINAFNAAYDQKNIHAYRWAISLNYIVGRLLLTIGNREEALAAFVACANMDPLHFSPLLATKTVLSRLYAGMILAGNMDIAAAKEQFSAGVKEAQRAIQQGNWEMITGDSANQPLAFGLTEAGEVLELGSQCIQALQAIEKQGYVPGYFWSRINLRRFGLLEWNKNLERENEQLRKQLSSMRVPA